MLVQPMQSSSTSHCQYGFSRASGSLISHSEIYLFAGVPMPRTGFAVVLTICSSLVSAQVLIPRSGKAAPETAAAPQPQTLDLSVPAGTPLRVALDKEVRIRKVGQPIRGKLLEPVYAFDKMVIPAGSEVTGEIAQLEHVTKKKRTLALMNGDFSPLRQVRLEFDQVHLPDGRVVPVQTDVSPGSKGVLELVAPKLKNKKAEIKGEASKKVAEARQQVRQDWNQATRQLHEPGKVHRLLRYGVAKLPYHPQYIEAGTAYNADLVEPLAFGQETITATSIASLNAPPPPGSMLHAVLVTPLTSATATKDDTVEAIVTQPLFAAGHVVLPQGTVLKGRVLQARRARRLHRNGQLRIVFHEVVPPSGITRGVDASIEAVAAGKDENLKLDSEGGAQVTSPKTRYLTTGIAVALATSSFGSDGDRGQAADRGDAGGGALNGASGYRLVGSLLGAFARSRALTSTMGMYGAGLSVYSHFISRGRDVVYPKDMSIVVGLGDRIGPEKK
jgi:hypothetical protein